MNRIAYLSATVGASIAVVPSVVNAQVKKPAANEHYNVVFIISDQHKTAITGCYGDPIVKTPNIDALAANGVKFTRMYTPSPLSAPARAALMTGTYPSTNGALLHKMLVNKNGKEIETEAGKYRAGYKEGMSTWGEVMKKDGYATAAIGKMHVHGELQAGVNPQYPEGNKMGFDVSEMRFYTSFPGAHYNNWKNNPQYNMQYRELGEYSEDRKGNNFNQRLLPTLIQNEEDIFDFIVADKSNNFMAACAKKNVPFFIHVGFEKPHKPWTTSQRFYDMYTTEEMVLPETYRDWHENGMYPYVKKGTHNPLTDINDIKRSMRAYYGCVSELDDAVGRIVEETKKLGIYDKTIFVYTTDHGEHLYEHGFHEKHNMFEDAVNIPFIISCPALFPQGITCNSLASMIDILPTLADLFGDKPEAQWEGKSLLSEIGAKECWDRPVFSEFYQYEFSAFPNQHVSLRMYLDNQYKYVYTHGMIDQLYDVTGKDPNEMTNLALDKKYADIIEHYRLLTLNNWIIPFASQMKAQVEKKGSEVNVSWSPIAEAKNYTVWSSQTPDINKAVKVSEVSTTNYTATKNPAKYYWVTANWNFTANGNRKENVPMITAKLPKQLPITAMLQVK